MVLGQVCGVLGTRVTRDNVEILRLQAGRDLREFPSDSGVLLLVLPWDGVREEKKNPPGYNKLWGYLEGEKDRGEQMTRTHTFPHMGTTALGVDQGPR